MKKVSKKFLFKYQKRVFPKLLIYAFIIFLPKFCLAGIQISEIYYDPPGTDTGHEWIEIENNSDSDVDLTGWKFFENNSNHTLTLIAGSAVIPAHGFAIIADNAVTFSSDFPQFSGILFDSVFSLSNTGETLVLKDVNGEVIDTAVYTSESGANGDGNSLNGSQNTWQSFLATPGASNSNQSNDSGDNSGSGGNSGNGDNGGGDNGGNNNQNNNSNNSQSGSSIGTSTTTATKKEKNYSAKITLVSNTVLADSDVIFNAKIINLEGLATTRGNLFWNFGDGESIYLRSAEPIVHSYVYPGRYVATLMYYENYYDPLPKVTDRITITVKEVQIEFEDDGLSIFLKNTSNTEMDISYWQIGNINSKFSFPKNSILLSGGYLILEKKHIGLSESFPYELHYSNTKLIKSSAYINQDTTLDLPVQIMVEPVDEGKFKEGARDSEVILGEVAEEKILEGNETEEKATEEKTLEEITNEEGIETSENPTSSQEDNASAESKISKRNIFSKRKLLLYLTIAITSILLVIILRQSGKTSE